MTIQGRIEVPQSTRSREPRNRRVADAESRIDIDNLRAGEIGGVVGTVSRSLKTGSLVTSASLRASAHSRVEGSRLGH
jgi:hypothetical protein